MKKLEKFRKVGECTSKTHGKKTFSESLEKGELEKVEGLDSNNWGFGMIERWGER